MENNAFEKEYSILCIYNGGKPFRIHIFDNLTSAKIQLYEMIQLEEERNRIYYVDNDFFNNKYPIGLQGSKYFCIQEREVSKWNKYKIAKKNKNKTNKNDNVLIFRQSI